MSSPTAADQYARTHQCESLEERLALTSHALAELPELVQFSGLDAALMTHSIRGVADPNQQVDYVRDQYSFDGSGQTVAVIDSGIAWDHYALGGGLGEDFRVVGGWDFAENDSNPFDDGPAGFHGTHVSGIIGSDDIHHEGVASGVDLVGLRVFDDMGAGKLEWVEQALQWVHEHRNEFENPITTVNLSLGLNWNSNSVPDWATLEDEFSQLKKDGIFISVAAGNSFQNYRTEGVSYPAASPSVVPVASHGSDGSLSDFSQRNDRVLVAPGENISSTIPAHLYGQSGPSSKFMATSGTSMAAPYLAGASVLLREAFDVAGESGINQDDLYYHFHRTADQIYDSITGSWYSRLNLSAAIDAAVEDGHGNRMDNATQLGQASRISGFEGILAQAGDVDYFRFRADQSGTIKFSPESSHDLNLQLSVVGQSVKRDGNEISFQVENGQEYFIRLSGTSGQGNYQVAVDLQTSTPAKNLGIVRANLFENLSNQGESFYRITAGRNAMLTVESVFAQTGGKLTFEVYNSADQLVATSDETSTGARADFLARQGESFVVKITGNQSDFDLKFTNLVRTLGSRVIAGGTGQSDTYTYNLQGQQHHLVVNGTDYFFSRSEYDKIRINGGTGHDRVELTGSNQAENLSGGSGQLIFYGSATDVVARNFESAFVQGNGGNDRAVINDTSAADYFVGTSSRSTLNGGGYFLSMDDFERVTVISNLGGEDRAKLIGTSGDDFLHIHENGTSLANQDSQNYVIGFEEIIVSGGWGTDQVIARGTTDSERFSVNASGMSFQNRQGETAFDGFTDVTVLAGGGTDQAIFRGLRDADYLNQNGEVIHGIVFGNQIALENFHDVDLTNTAATHPSVGLSAVDEIFDSYATD